MRNIKAKIHKASKDLINFKINKFIMTINKRIQKRKFNKERRKIVSLQPNRNASNIGCANQKTMNIMTPNYSKNKIHIC
jgi:hypothetical protein